MTIDTTSPRRLVVLDFNYRYLDVRLPEGEAVTTQAALLRLATPVEVGPSIALVLSPNDRQDVVAGYRKMLLRHMEGEGGPQVHFNYFDPNGEVASSHALPGQAGFEIQMAVYNGHLRAVRQDEQLPAVLVDLGFVTTPAFPDGWAADWDDLTDLLRRGMLASLHYDEVVVFVYDGGDLVPVSFPLPPFG